MSEAADHGAAPAGPAAAATTWPAVMTKSAYGEYRRATTGRGSPPMVSKYIRDGKIAAPALRPDGRIDRVLADAQLARTLNMAGRPENRPPSAIPTAPEPVGDEDANPGVESDAEGTPPASGTLAAEQTALTKARRRKVELEIAQTEGRLVDKAEVEREVFDIGRRVRDRVMAVPGRIAAHLVAKGEREISALLRDAIMEALNEAADDMESDGGDSGVGDR